jgi:drug/metabolite transporter (DMT)-like permease
MITRFTIIFIPILMSAVAQIILKLGLGDLSTKSGPINFLLKALTSPGVIIGLIIYALGAMLWLIVLSREDVSFAFPLVSLAYVIAIVLSAVILKEEITLPKIIGSLIIIVGIFIIARFG